MQPIFTTKINLIITILHCLKEETGNMRSSRYRKLMQGVKQLTQAPTTAYHITGSEGSSYHCELNIWKEEVFSELQGGLKVRDLLAQFKQWIELPAEILGKKSSEVALSKNQLFCLKTIGQQDFQTFRQILADYIAFKKSKNSNILIPVLAVVSLSTLYQPKIRWFDCFIIMPNLKPAKGVVFDIKGHCDNRQVVESDYRDFSFGKDQNFVKSKYKQLLLSTTQDFREKLMQQIRENVNFLKSCKVIDYSLLFVFSEDEKQCENAKNHYRINEQCCFRWAIIDFLQTYNEKKRLQNRFKSLFFKEVSSADPDTYASRLLDFLQKTILPK